MAWVLRPEQLANNQKQNLGYYRDRQQHYISNDWKEAHHKEHARNKQNVAHVWCAGSTRFQTAMNAPELRAKTFRHFLFDFHGIERPERHWSECFLTKFLTAFASLESRFVLEWGPNSHHSDTKRTPSVRT
ncbi:MAG: hypothetical protein R3C08_06315 [Hyphomonas sp.]